MSSNIMTVVISVERFINIVLKPMQKGGLTVVQAVACLVASLLYAVLPVVLATVLSNTYIQTSLCIMLGKSVHFSISIIYAISNIVNFVVVVVVYTSIIRTVLQGSKIQKTTDSSHKVVIRLGAIIITNFLPSIFIIILSLVSFSPNTLPASIEANISYLLFPLNAVLNQFINIKFLRQGQSHVCYLFQRKWCSPANNSCKNKDIMWENSIKVL